MNEIIERLNNFFGERPGLLPMVGVLLVVLNFLLQIFPGPDSSWLVESNLFLHLGVLFGLVGILLIRPLS